MATLMVETPLAFGLTMIVCLALFFYCWRIRKIRNRIMTSVQVSAIPIELPPVEQTGLKMEVIVTFPTVRAHELKVDIKEGLQCPICLVEYGEAEVLRKLPLCGHVFHIRCVDSWLQKQVTCPVCRIVLTGVSKQASRQRQQSATSFWRVASIPESVAVQVAGGGSPVPAWVLVNRPMPLPPAVAETSAVDTSASDPSSSDVELQPSDNQSESPLLERHTAKGWGAVYLERSQGRLSFRAQTKECVDHSSISERWMTESFFFGVSSCDEGESRTGSSFDDSAPHSRKSSRSSWRSDSSKRPASWSSRSVNSSWDFNQPTIQAWQSEFEHSADEVFESRVVPHRPLTMSPERCSFEFLPIVTGPGGDYSFRPPKSPLGGPWVGAGRHSYAQL